jgi:hypothetical protein
VKSLTLEEGNPNNSEKHNGKLPVLPYARGMPIERMMAARGVAVAAGQAAVGRDHGSAL